MESDEICENKRRWPYTLYDRDLMFCTNRNEIPCHHDGPIMAIDRHDPANPYWYVVGFYAFGQTPCRRFENYPKVLTKVVPHLDFITKLISRFGTI